MVPPMPTRPSGVATSSTLVPLRACSPRTLATAPVSPRLTAPSPRPALAATSDGPMPFSQATAGTPGTDAARKSQHARQLDVNLFSDVKKLRLRARNLTSEKIFTCYRPDPGPKRRAAARPAAPQAKRHCPTARHWRPAVARRPAESYGHCPPIKLPGRVTGTSNS